MEDRIRGQQEKLVESNTETLTWKAHGGSLAPQVRLGSLLSLKKIEKRALGKVKFESLERDSSPASKEYLKNLVLQYLAVGDKSKKLSMQTALMTILELTNEDIR